MHNAIITIDPPTVITLLNLSATAPEKNEAITTGTPVIRPYNKEKF